MGASLLLLILIAVFTGIIIWVFGRKRKAPFAEDARIPLDDENQEPPGPPQAGRPA